MWSFPSPHLNSHSPPLSPPSPKHGPYFASALAESPEVSGFHFPHSAHTPPQHRLDPVDEDPGLSGTGMTGKTGSGGSRAPLLSHDFASRPMVDRLNDHREQDDHEQGDNDGSVREVQSVKSDVPTIHPPPKGKSAPSNPRLIPPPSVHDAFVSRIIQPMAPPDALPPTQPPSPAAENRPPIFRTASAPTQASPNAPRRLLPSPLPSKPTRKVEEGTPIFEIFDADLGAPASEMVKALKEHLEGVLRVQEEIGRMHLGLEKLTVVGPGSWEDSEPISPNAAEVNKTPGKRAQGEIPTTGDSEGKSRRGSKETPGTAKLDGDESGNKARKVEAEQALLKREQEVDEIMSKLGTLSERLRTYHTLGTPRLSFPQPGATSPMSPTSPPLPTPSASRTTPKRLHDNYKDISPPHIAVANLRGQPMPLSPMQQIRQRSNSNLGLSTFSRSMTKLEEPSAETADHPTHSDHPYRSNKSGLFNNSSVSVLRQHTPEEEPDARRGKPDPLFSPTSPMEDQTTASGHLASWAFGDESKSKERERGEESWVEHSKMKSPETSRASVRNTGRRWVDSPVELVDRSRPW